MRTVTINIESSEGPTLTIRKRFVDGVIEVSTWRGGGEPVTYVGGVHEDALKEMAEAAAKFVREVG